MADRCDKCRFWKRDPDLDDELDPSWGFGHCRVAPPRLVTPALAAVMPKPRYGSQVDPEIDTLTLSCASLFPATHSSDWCGVFSHIGSDASPC